MKLFGKQLRTIPTALFVLLVVLASCSDGDDQTGLLPQGEGGQAMKVPGGLHLAPVNIIDPNGFGQPMIASSVLVPVGWSYQGGVQWQQQSAPCGKRSPHTSWIAVSPDGQQAVEILGEELWNGDQLQIPQQARGGCPNVWPQDARSFVTDYAMRHRPNARVLDYRDLPPHEIQKAQNYLDLISGPDASGPNRRTFHGGKVLLAYNLNGIEMRESIHLGFVLTPTVMPDGMGGHQQAITISTLPGFAVRAPAGQLDLKYADLFAHSARSNPRYADKIAANNAARTGAVADATRARSALTARTGEQLRQIQSDYWDRQTASQDRGQGLVIGNIRDAQKYADPYAIGGEIELDNAFQNAWRLQDGSYVMTDDSSFNPMLAIGQDGQQLRRIP